MVKQTINGQRVLQLKIKTKYISFLIILSTSVGASEPIAYLNTLGYEPAQKKMAESNFSH